MPGPFITGDDLLTVIAAGLKTAKASLKSYWTEIAGRCVTRGWMDLATALLAKGYTEAQLDQWDDRVQYNTDQALFWAYTEGGGPTIEGQDNNYNRFDRAAAFLKQPPADIAIRIGGAMVAPGASGEAAAVASGCLNMAGGKLGVHAGTSFGLKSQRREGGYNEFGDAISEWD